MSGELTNMPQDSIWFRNVRKRLLSWYAVDHRPLPWRATRDAYAIWVSEIMLQQTQVATVIDFYYRFLERFPDVQTLAAADEQEVLKLWSGLGYYRRAKQLHAASRVICENHGAKFPTDFEDVLSLPGIGRYTAGAITSFAYDQPRPILEANTTRLFSRLMVLESDPRSAQSQQRLWDFAERLLPRGGGQRASASGPGRVNQALIELGSQICTPRLPQCDRCPLRRLCPTFRLGLQHAIPKPKPKQEFVAESHVLLILERRGCYLMRQNDRGQWWEGLWDFPRLRVDFPMPELDPNGMFRAGLVPKIENRFLYDLGLDCRVSRFLRTFKHAVTKYRINLFCLTAQWRSPAPLAELQGTWKWVPKRRTAEIVPLTSTAARLHEWLRTRSPAIDSAKVDDDP